MRNKFDEEEVLDREKVEKIVPKQFHRWLKTFGKVASERMLVVRMWL